MNVSRKDFLGGLFGAAAAAAAGILHLRPGKARAGVLRPPGALEEEEFLARCIRCGRCAEACPNRCITAFTDESGAPFSISPGSGEWGTPAIFPRRQPCNLCAGVPGDLLRCTASCPTGALRPVGRTFDALQAGVGMGKARLDLNLCYSYNGSSCGVCVRACPFEGRALRAGQFERPVLDPDYCVGCGLCERVCIRYPQAMSVRPAEGGAA